MLKQLLNDRKQNPCVILDEIQGMMLKGVLDYKKKQDPCVINNEIKRGGNKRSLMTKREPLWN